MPTHRPKVSMRLGASRGMLARVLMFAPTLGGWNHALAQAETVPELPRAAFRVTPAIDARVIATNNAGTNANNQIQRDLVTEIQPSVTFERHGPRVALSGSASISELDYARKTQPHRSLPRGRLDMSAKVVDGLIFFDGWARVDPTFEDPFAAQPEAATAYKLESRRRYGLSPYLLKHFGSTATVLARSDYVASRVTAVDASTRTTATALDNTVSVEHNPLPLGALLEAKSHSESTDLVNQPVLETSSGRIWLTYALDPQVLVGADAGRERVATSSTTFVDRFYGGRVQLKPTDRTDLSLKLEHRYFGSAWDASAVHRTRMLSFSLQSSRIVSSQDIPDVSSLANGSAGAVPPPTPGGNTAVVPKSSLTLYTTAPQLRQSTALEIDLRGRRNLVYLQVGYLKTQILQSLSTVGNGNAADITQKSAVLGWNLQVTPVTALNVIGEWHNAARLVCQGECNYSTQKAGRGELVFTMSPKSSLTIGARKSAVQSNFLNAVDTAGEVAVYAGLRHRF